MYLKYHYTYVPGRVDMFYDQNLHLSLEIACVSYTLSFRVVI